MEDISGNVDPDEYPVFIDERLEEDAYRERMMFVPPKEYECSAGHIHPYWEDCSFHDYMITKRYKDD